MSEGQAIAQSNGQDEPAVPLIRLSGVGRIFDQGAIVALDRVDLSIARGDCVAILGPSGSGKSSLINVLSGIDTPSTGTVYWQDGAVVTREQWTSLRRRQIGIVFQEFNLLPTLTALENVEMPMFGMGIRSELRRRRAQRVLEKVGLSSRVNNLPHQLSGGERQRVAIARSIVNEPILLLADEPTGNLDRANSQNVTDVLFSVGQRNGATLVVVTHDEALARRCRRCVRLLDGRVAAEGLPPQAA